MAESVACGYCRDCEWWDRGECLRPKSRGGKFHAPYFAGEWGEYNAAADLETDEDFGCVQWQLKGE